MQLATQAIGVPFGRAHNVGDIRYAYDVSYRAGLAVPTVKVDDISGVAVNAVPGSDMAEAAICPVDVGACVTSTAGGTLVGWDMYGQMVMEDVAAAGTSTIAFAGLVDAPEDAQWVNQFGLPYMWKAAAADDPGGVTYVPPAEDEDARGTFTVDAGVTEPTDVQLYYVADQVALLGVPYANRFASPEFDTSTLEVTGAITAGGLATVTIPSTGGTEVPCQIMWGDGTYDYALSGTAPTHQYGGLWLSQYGRSITEPQQMSQFVTVDPLGNEYAPVYVTFDSVPDAAAMMAPEGEPEALVEPASAPAPPPGNVPAVPSSFASHTAADAWLADYTAAVDGFDPASIEWEGQTLMQKRDTALALYDTATQ